MTAARHHAPPHGVLAAIKGLFEIIIAALFLVTFVVQPSRIPSESMLPTLRVGDFLLLDKQSYAPSGLLDHLLPPTTPRRGDLVVFHYPVDGSIHLVKRVVGLPGERVEVREGTVLVDGAPLPEPYVHFPDHRSAPAVTLPADGYYVLGDNRAESDDSRNWGVLHATDIAGKAVVGIWPPRRL